MFVRFFSNRKAKNFAYHCHSQHKNCYILPLQDGDVVLKNSIGNATENANAVQ